MTKHIFLFLVGFVSYTKTATAQIEKIDTDRPDQTESPFTVPKKFIQTEIGFVAEKADVYFSNFSIPTMLTKYGLTKKTELRLITELSGSNSKLYTLNEVKITTPLQIGFKTALWEEKGLLPKTSLIFHTSLQSIKQTGIKNKEEIACNYRFTLQHSITKNMSLGYNIGMQWESMQEPPAYVYTITTGINIGEAWYAYTEAFGSIFKNEAPENNIDAGLAYLINDNFKIDISGGIGISEAAARHYFAIGASFRFKTGK